MTTLSKEDYLKRYLSGEATGEQKSKKKKKRHAAPVRQSRMKIIDEDISLNILAVQENEQHIEDHIEEELDDELPTVAEIIDDRPEQVKLLEAYQRSGQWKAVGAQDKDESKSKKSVKNRTSTKAHKHSKESSYTGNDSDDSPARRTRHDSDESPARRTRHDSDESPARRTRHDSDESPVRRAMHESDGSDLSPVRPQRGSDSDQSPTRAVDSDNSPVRRGRTNSSSDNSPVRRKRRTDNPDRSDAKEGSKRPLKDNKSKSNRRDDYSDEISDRMKKTLGGKKAGLSSAAQMRDEMVEKKRKEDIAFSKLDSSTLGRGAETVRRERGTGKRRDMELEAEQRAQEQRVKDERKRKYDQWGQGLQQGEEQRQRLHEAEHEMSKPLARYHDDQDMDAELRLKARADDPMLAYIARQRDKGKTAEERKKERPKYRGPAPAPNRFGIGPGYRWDGVDRSTGFEKKLFQSQSNKKATELAAYLWSVEDM